MLTGHGGNVYDAAQELQISITDILDFSSNTSALPHCFDFYSFLTENISQISRLPEVDSQTLRNAVALRYGLSSEQIIICPGTTEFIYLIPRICQMQGITEAVMFVPTYADYFDACKLNQVGITTLSLFDNAIEDIVMSASFISNNRQKLIFLCNPNNPTGEFMRPETVLQAVSSHPEVFWVVDESYAPFIGDDAISSLLCHDLPENLVVLRSFSKIYGIPGLRVGFLASRSLKLLEQLKQFARPWSVCRLSQIAAEYCLGAREYEEAVRALCMEEKAFICKEIGENVPYLLPKPKDAHFVIFEVKKPWGAARLAAELRNQRVLVRDCSNFMGFSGDYIRISPRTRKENLMLLERLMSLV